MSTPPEEPELQNGAVHEPESEAKPVAEAEPEPEPAPVLAESAVTADGDPGPEETEPNRPSEIQPVEPNDPHPAEEPARPQLKKDEGSRTFTMRELLNELKTDQNETNSPYRLVLSCQFKLGSGTFTQLMTGSGVSSKLWSRLAQQKLIALTLIDLSQSALKAD